MVVERNDPKPATLENVVQGALRIWILEAMFASRSADLIVVFHTDHVRKYRSRVCAKLVRVVAKTKLARQHGLHAGAVNQILASERLSLLAGQRHVIFMDVDIGDTRLLTDLGSVTHRHGHHVGVGILPEEMAVWAHRWCYRR